MVGKVGGNISFSRSCTNHQDGDYHYRILFVEPGHFCILTPSHITKVQRPREDTSVPNPAML